MNARWTLDNKRALVTGATKGIGQAVADELCALGATVLVVARDADGVNGAVADLAARHAAGRVFGIAADVTHEDGRRAVLDKANDALGGLDILVNNVGTNIRKPSLDYSADDYAFLLQTNLTSAWEMCRAAHPLLSASGDNASIVNVGSVAGSVSVHSGAPYAMTKAALDQLTRYLAVEWAPNNIRVNCVAPWYTYTPLANAVLSRPEFEAGVLARTPLGRVAVPEDISGAVAFLCLPCARHITGQVLSVDGGFTAFGF